MCNLNINCISMGYMFLIFLIIQSTLRSELLGGEKPCFYTAGNSTDEKLSIVGYGLINMEICHDNPCDLIPDCIIFRCQAIQY